MEAKELRIGNKVGIYKNHHDTDVINILPNDILAMYQCGIAKKQSPYFAIPLTHKNLLDFEFKATMNYYHNKSILNKTFKIVELESKYYYHDSHFMTRLEYVHQLQNLYFALTDKELTLKN